MVLLTKIKAKIPSLKSAEALAPQAKQLILP